MKNKIILLSLVWLMLSITTTYGQSEMTLKESDITYMLEEEKLARDVYLALYNKWEHKAFKNISGAEQRHYEQMQKLAAANNLAIPMPVKEDVAGVFQNIKLQNFYNNSVKEGRSSLKNALKVGAKIEELDIKDLKETILHTDDVISIQVYENLLHGSENHLRAFARNLDKVGETYQPVILSQEDYTAIISSDNKGKKGGKNKGKRNQKKYGDKKGTGKKCCSSK